jgi:shikimate dehydrogenase
MEGCDLVVNCTSVGLAGGALADQMPLPAAAIPSAAAVVDVIANPLVTPLLKSANAAGHATLGGLSMLVYQGALSFQLWTGVEPPIDVMMAAANEAMHKEASPQRSPGRRGRPE